MFGPEIGVCNYLSLVNIYGMLILGICAFRHLNYKACIKKKPHKGGVGVGITGTPGPPLYFEEEVQDCKDGSELRLIFGQDVQKSKLQLR